MTEPCMVRSELEIQRAHDMLVGIILGDVPREILGAQILEEIRRIAPVLCWVLGHDHNDAFARLLADVEQTLRAQGILLSAPVRTPPSPAVQ